jgi:phage terminase small subunit
MKQNRSKKLTEKQKLFVAEYLVDLNATKAYIRAGYSAKGADVSAARLLVNTSGSSQR